MTGGQLVRFALMCAASMGGGRLTGIAQKQFELSNFDAILCLAMLLFLIQGANAALWWRIDYEGNK